MLERSYGLRPDPNIGDVHRGEGSAASLDPGQLAQREAPNHTTVRSAAASAADLGARLNNLSQISYADLRTEWRRLYRSHPPKKISRDLLELGVAWKLQERALGGLGPALQRRLADLSQTMESKGDLAKARLLRLRPGARLMREWGGQTHEVLVLADGFEWQHRKWRSLSVIAREITGTQWSGPRFFGLQANVRTDVGAAGLAREYADA